MRPFKFFFMASVGIIIFLFVARVLFTALIIAAIFSLVYYIGRGIIHFFSKMNWDDRYASQYQLGQEDRSFYQNSPFQKQYSMDSLKETVIKIH